MAGQVRYTKKRNFILDGGVTPAVQYPILSGQTGTTYGGAAGLLSPGDFVCINPSGTFQGQILASNIWPPSYSPVASVSSATLTMESAAFVTGCATILPNVVVHQRNATSQGTLTRMDTVASVSTSVSITIASGTGTLAHDIIENLSAKMYYVQSSSNPNQANVPAPTNLSIHPVGIGDQFLLYLYNSTAATAVWNSNLVGQPAALRYDSTNKAWAASINATDIADLPALRIVDVVTSDVSYAWPSAGGASTIQYPAVWVEVTSAYWPVNGSVVL